MLKLNMAPPLTQEKTVWQRLNLAFIWVTLVLLAITAFLLWMQQTGIERQRKTLEASLHGKRIEFSLLHSRAAVRDLLAGSDPEKARAAYDTALSEFQAGVDSIREAHKDRPALMKAATQLRDFVTGPLNALHLRYFGPGSPTLLESTAYDNLHYPPMQAELKLLLQTLVSEIENVQIAQNQADKQASNTRMSVVALGIIAIALGLAFRARALQEGRRLVSAGEDRARSLREVNEAANKGLAGTAELEKAFREAMSNSEVVENFPVRFNERLQHASDTVSALSRMTDQSNLLSINAGIEAEKAGEHGLAFAVIAMEIRRLSEQMAETSSDLERILAEAKSAAMKTGDVARKEASLRSFESSLDQMRACLKQMAHDSAQPEKAKENV